MSLFIRLQTSFWTHRKTLRLRARIGEAALWVLPRLWSYAAENQPDGDFSKYSAEELALLLGYNADAQALLQALQEVGWMDGMEIHDWTEYNSYHQKFSERAKNAANARWEKEKKRKEKRGEERRGEEKRQALLSDAPSILPKELDNSMFQSSWERWGEYRKQAKLKKYTSIGAEQQLKKLAEIGSERAIAAIENSIANGYQGIFEPKHNGSAKTPTPQESTKYQDKYGW